MNYLTALLAFSAIMIVLATLASVLVESIHRLLKTRSRDFDEMLTQLYKQSVRPHFKSAGITLADEAENFVREIRRNPAISYKRNGLFNRYFVKTEFEELTTRQFVEQLAQSESGQKLLQKVEQHETELAANTISKLSYEFERYGQAATEYFKRRAAFLSMIVAFVLAIALNIDAVRLFESLAKDPELAQQVIEKIDVEELRQKRDEDLAKAADDEEEKQSIEEKYQGMLDNYEQVSNQLQNLELPIGHAFYPYCAEGGWVDEQCNSKGIFTLDALAWLFKIFLTTGLIGLGAPFWYKAYRQVGQLIPGRQPPPSESTAERSQTPAKKVSKQPIIIGMPKPLVTTVTAAPTAATQQEPAVTVSARSVRRADAGEAVEDEKAQPGIQATGMETRLVTPVQEPVKKGLYKDDLLNIFTNAPVSENIKKENGGN